MTSVHSQTEGAMRILEVFREHAVPAGETFNADSMRLTFQNGTFSVADFLPAIELAIVNGWIVDRGSSYVLTQAGYDAIAR